MSLTFDDRGLLAPGIHDATPAEVDEAFGRFQRTDRRLKDASAKMVTRTFLFSMWPTVTLLI